MGNIFTNFKLIFYSSRLWKPSDLEILQILWSKRFRSIHRCQTLMIFIYLSYFEIPFRPKNERKCYKKENCLFWSRKIWNFFTGERHRKISFIQRAQQHFVDSSDNRILTFTRRRPTPQNVKLLEPKIYFVRREKK